MEPLYIPSKKGYIKIQDPSKIFFTSDTHFGHAKLIEYCSRPFPGGVEEMDETMIARWNEVVPEDGVVFHLGDFSFHSATKYRGIASSLHGRKILILGNHDHRTLKRDVFEDIQGMLHLKIDGQELYLSHFPYLTWTGKTDGRIWNLHGHLHGKKEDIQTSPGQLDVGVDGHDFRPWTWEEIKNKIDRDS